MCRVRLNAKGVLEVFPSIASDDVDQIVLVDVDAGDELDVKAVDVDSYSFTFVFPDGRSSSMPREVIEVIRDCGACELTRASDMTDASRHLRHRDSFQAAPTHLLSEDPVGGTWY